MDYESIQPILQWISDHPTWAGFVVFLISLSESLAIVGLFVPGVVMMTAIGAMMGGGILPFWETLLWAILGAIAGDGISYWLGYHYHEHLRDFWPFRQFPGLLKRGENFFKEHGGKSIIFGRFVGPVRPMIPVIAGMMDMTPRRFLVFNILSAIAWAPLYSLPGIIIGASLGTLSPEVGRRIVLVILVLLLFLWLLYVVLLKFGIWIGSITQHSLSRIWHKWQKSNQLSWLHKMLATAQGTEEGQLGAALLFVVSMISFLLITWHVWKSSGISLINEHVYQALRALYTDRLVDISTFITGLGEYKILLPVAFAVGVYLWWKKYRFAALCWLGTIGIAEAIGYSLKSIIAVPRPEGLAQFTTEYSYPSGHALTITLVFGLAAAFIQHSVAANHRWIPWAISIPLIFIICFTRIYLGVHWFTDVMGGLMLGIAAISLGILIFRRLEHKTPPMRDILIPGLIVLILSMTFYTIKMYPKKRMEVVRQWPQEKLDVNQWWQETGDAYEQYRTGAIKRIATYFDIQWLGELNQIQKNLEAQGWTTLPKLDFQTGLVFLSSEPNPRTSPVMPKFHRDRLPTLVMTKPLDKHQRLLLQLWQSDYTDDQNTPLWVGTLRVENLEHPIPFISFVTVYDELPFQVEVLNRLSEDLKKAPNTSFRIHPSTTSNINQMLFIQSKKP